MASSGVVAPAHAAGQCRALAKRGWLGLLPGLWLAGCGGGSPLLHPAHALPVNTVSFGAGVSSQFASDSAEGRIAEGRSAASRPLSEPANAQSYSEGVLLEALLAPGVGPWVAARVGLPWQAEAGLTYTGRSIRLDGRHVLPLGEAWALSLGLGASALLLSRESSAPAGAGGGSANAEAEFDLNASGWGADIPVIIGYEAVDGFVDVWAGARAGFEHASGQVLSRAGDASAPRFDAEGRRWWGGGLAGFSLGVPPLWLRFELAAAFHQVTGQLTGGASGAAGQPAPDLGSVDIQGWTFSPSGAILGKF